MRFFSPSGEHPACGMFTPQHLITLGICLILIVIGVYCSRKLKEKQIFWIIRVVAILVTILEIIKIGYKFYYNQTYLDAWFPLAYCSLFIYSIWMVGFGKGRIRAIGLGFLVGGGIIAGLAFLIFPTTSLMMHPIHHFLSIHSMIFHSLMMYVGITCYLHKLFVFNKKGYISYCLFCLVFMFLALIVNKIYDCNMMFLKEPFNIPLPILQEIRNNNQGLYTLIIMVVYLTIPYGGVFLIDKILNKGEKDV